MFRFGERFYLGVANNIFKNQGFEKFWYGLKISADLCHVSKSRLTGAFSVLDPRIFFHKVSESRILLSSISKSRNFV